MKFKYGLSFPAGFETVIKEAIPKMVQLEKILHLDQSMVIFSSSSSPKRLSKLPFNSFLVVEHKEFNPPVLTKRVINFLVRANNLQRVNFAKSKPRPQTFRFMLSKEGVLTKIPPKLKKRKISQIARLLSLKYNPFQPNTELWVVIRKNGFSFLGLRLKKEKRRKKGELSPAVAYLLNFLSRPSPTDVFLDPFAGYGAIALSRACHFPYQTIIINDKNPSLVKRLRKRFKGYQNIQILSENALHLQKIPDESIDVIVTDPPWGEYQPLECPAPEFYPQMLAELKRVLKSQGRIVVLMGRKKQRYLKQAIEANKLVPKKRLNVLVAGKKANVYLLYKRS